ncbi:MAG: cbb3-type cytochrome oxidase assembly protein CcoS [Nitrospinae bacterium]|nr:cbb3-type cytochrome oxidase assembly protein CcoS [Nitrospinota bacterium]
MEVLYWLVPSIIAVGAAMVGVLFWAIKSGQYEDMEGPSHKILMDDDDPRLPGGGKKKRP